MADELDRNMVNLVTALNEIPGIETIGSCGGHKRPKGSQWNQGTWYVKFEDRGITKDTLMLLGWFINVNYRKQYDIFLLPKNPAPSWNPTVTNIHWVIECYDSRLLPDIAADHIRFYVIDKCIHRTDTKTV